MAELFRLPSRLWPFCVAYIDTLCADLCHFLKQSLQTT